MIKTVINKFIKAALDELFINTPSVQLSMGSDMFSDSKINLSNLTFRPDIFDSIAQPLILSAGHLGSLNVEGIAELALGGQLRFTAEDIFLLFSIDANPDPEKVQSMKKILIELQSGKFSSAILMDLLKKIQGIATGPEADVKAKRKTIYKAFDYFSKGFFFTIKNIHFRFEFKSLGLQNEKLCNALGITIPFIKISPAPQQLQPSEVSSQNPVVLLSAKSLVIYADYLREYYFRNDIEATVNFFKKQWNAEQHLLVLGLSEIEIIIALDIKRRTGLVCPKISLRIPRVRLALDKTQLEIIDQAINALVCVSKRFQQVIRIQKIFRSGFPLPKVSEFTAIKLLPHLAFRGLQYPSQCGIPRSETVGLVSFMKDRVGSRWPIMLWKHLIRLVLHDVQSTRPFGKWKEISWLCKVRREYAFSYARLLKRSNDSLGFTFNGNGNLSAAKLRDLFEYEMVLSSQAIFMFRTLAYMIAVVGYFDSKKKSSSSPVNQQSLPWERMSIVWTDILKIFTELFEAKRESAFHRFDRNRHDEDDEGHNFDDSSTSKGSDDGTVYSHTTQSRLNITSEERITPNRQTNSSKINLSMQNVTKKLFSNIGLGSSAHGDEYERKVFGKLDFSSFGDSLNRLLDKDDRIKDFEDALGVGETSFVITDEIEILIRKPSASPLSQSPQLPQIVEAVQWALLRHQDPLTFMPPDLSIKVENSVLELRLPLERNRKDRGLEYNDKYFSVDVKPQVGNSDTKVDTEKIKSLRGFASLSGALIQLRIVVKHLSTSLLLPSTTDIPNNVPTPAKKVTESVLERASNVTKIETKEDGSEDGDDGDVSAETSQRDLPSESSVKVVELKTFKGLPVSQVNYIPGKTIMESLQYQQKLVEQEKSADSFLVPSTKKPLDERSTQNSHLSLNKLTIDAPLPTLKSRRTTGLSDNDEELREIIVSSNTDNIFVFCVIMDLDDKGDGAADLQIQVGSLLADMKSRSVASLMNKTYINYINDMWKIYEDITKCLFLLEDPSILVDWSSKIPFVQLDFNSILSHINEEKHTDGEDANLKNSLSEEADTDRHDSSEQQRHMAITFNRSFVHWLSFLEKKLPKVLSFCFRSSPILVEFLESPLIKEFVFAKFQSVLDSAAKRHRGDFELETFFTVLGRLIRRQYGADQTTMKVHRKWGTKAKGMSSKFMASKATVNNSVENFNFRIFVPGLDLFIAKVSVPYSAVAVQLQGESVLKIPMSDETICHYLAWLLAEMMPVLR